MVASVFRHNYNDLTQRINDLEKWRQRQSWRVIESGLEVKQNFKKLQGSTPYYISVVIIKTTVCQAVSNHEVNIACRRWIGFTLAQDEPSH